MVTPSPIVAHTLPQVVAPISHPSSPLLASPLISTQNFKTFFTLGAAISPCQLNPPNKPNG
uniref:Uncharacterized protein n=1 Tax=Oryza punctata TaxID=4537 RepID=A0A0E0LK98_ORYPU